MKQKIHRPPNLRPWASEKSKIYFQIDEIYYLHLNIQIIKNNKKIHLEFDHITKSRSKN